MLRRTFILYEINTGFKVQTLRTLFFNMVSELKEPLADLLEKSIVFKLTFVRQILDFFPLDFDEEEENITEILKQFMYYDISAQTLRKIQ